MSLRYDELSKDAEAFAVFTGLPLDLFRTMLPGLLATFEAQRLDRLDRPDRQRAIGGGDDFDLTPADQLVLALVHLKRATTYREMAYHFGVSIATVSRVIARCLPVLDADAGGQVVVPADDDDTEPPESAKRPRKKRRAPCLKHLPKRIAVIDSFEQPIRRPKYQQKRYYSGKKKRHTIEVQLTADEATGRVIAVSDGVPGPRADIVLLKESGVLEELPAGFGVMGDSGYQGMGEAGGERVCVSPRKKPRGKERPAADRAFNRALSRRRVVVEHTIGRMRRFALLSVVFRHHKKRYDIRVRAVAGLVNRLIDYSMAA